MEGGRSGRFGRTHQTTALTAPSLRPRLSRRLLRRDTLRDDAVSGLVLGVESVPDGLASGLLAGVNPLSGLYGYLFGTLGGALFTSTPFMAVQATGAMALLVADVDLASRPDPERALFTLSIMTGLVMVAAGFLRLGSVLRFVPTAVMVGFISAVGINIVLGQLDSFTGYDAEGSGRILRAVDLVLHPWRIDVASIVVGVVTVVLIIVLQRTRLRAMGLVVAIIAGSALATLLDRGVALVSDLARVPNTLPTPTLPVLGDVAFLLVPAVSLAFVGLIQGAGVSTALPNPDGEPSDASQDFVGQGAGNVVAGLFQGMPVGGSMSASSLAAAGGARTRLSLFVASGVMAVVVLVLAGAVGRVAMPALAGLLMVVGAGAVKPARMRSVAGTGVLQTTVMVVTFGFTMVIPLQYAVLFGVGLAVVLYVVEESNALTIRQVVFDDDGRRRVADPPTEVGAGEVIVLQPYGSLFFASAPVFESQLPTVDPEGAGSVVVVRLRGVDRLGLSLVEVLRGYNRRLRDHGSRLALVLDGDAVRHQLVQTGAAEEIGDDRIYLGNEWLGETTRRAHDDAVAWVREQEGEAPTASP